MKFVALLVLAAFAAVIGWIVVSVIRLPDMYETEWY